MIQCDGLTVGEVFAAAVTKYSENALLVMPSDAGRPYHAGGFAMTYGDCAAVVADYTSTLQAAGYGHGHRIACLLANRPEMLLFKLAANALGISWTPVNPDYRAAEIGFLLKDSGAEFLLAGPELAALAEAGIAASGRDLALVTLSASGFVAPEAPTPPPLLGPPTPASEASLLYTSGTTGRPKGCMLSHAYELEVGAWYATVGGRMTLGEGVERVYNPLPLFHVNAGIVLFFGMLLTGNCQIATERFSRQKWWAEIRETQATGVHYLGIVIPALMKADPGPDDRAHTVRWGAGAGVEPSLHGAFEARFGFPLIELWGMTEMCRIFADAEEPRSIDTRAFGRPRPGLEARVVDRDDRPVPAGEPGELLVRHSAATPRRGAFSGYLNLPEATEAAWQGGWLHTGDTVIQDASGLLIFVDRKKNIIRRSGENIAAAEVEACLQPLDAVEQVAVLAVEDALRDEEVMACIVPRRAAPSAALARRLFDHCFAELAYFKAPGWIVFVDALPVTGTQKVQKHMIFKDGEDPRALANAFDMRSLKQR